MSMEHSFSISRLLLVGLVFHLCLIGTIFDAYFTSPVVHGMRHHRAPDKPEAKRLVLIVGDGLRADLLFQPYAFQSFVPNSPKIVAPYLRAILRERGAFGISHTRVPTESRPGHVALIAGMYEDVSAVTKGWKTNPVDFDSVFNQSSTTYSFGSPDILPMFAQGATPGKVKTWSYHEDEEDFTKDATALDIWSLDRLRDLFQNATYDHDLSAELKQDQVVIFLHLLGLDTTGHSYRPHSAEYMRNIQVVDDIVRQTEELVNDYYGDSETAFVFTADHGMSVIGNHGDGHPDNTRTPLIIWGKGVRGPVPDSIPSSHDAYSTNWNLSALYRQDVEQADIACIMATLIGIDWPVNSVGVLPDVDTRKPGFLHYSNGARGRANAALTNAKVLLEHFVLKAELKRAHTVFYKPYAPLESSNDSLGKITQQQSDIEYLIKHENFTEASTHAMQLIQTTLKGLRYLETYDRFLIEIIVIAAYTGWMVHGASLVLLKPTVTDSKKLGRLSAIVTLLSCWVFFYIQHSPWSFYIYAAFPAYFWSAAIARSWTTVHSFVVSGEPKFRALLTYLGTGAFAVATLLAMVVGYTHRSIWSLGFILIGIVWPTLGWPSEVHKRNRYLSIFWALSCLTTAVFPMLSVDKDESTSLIMTGGAVMILLGSTSIWILSRYELSDPKGKPWFPRMQLATQIFFINLSMVITQSSIRSLKAKTGLPVLNQLAGWTTLVASLLYPCLIKFSHPNDWTRLLSIFLALGPLFVILSISVEGLFYVAYAVTLILWIQMEVALRHSSSDIGNHFKNSLIRQEYRPRVEDLRIALFFLFFVQVGFFGTGNVASISSFYLAPVYRLVTIFDPFLMGALLIVKLLTPYVLLSAVFETLNEHLQLPSFSLFLIAMIITDVMTITFFFHVTDTGSWLEIGQSISFFCISSLLVFFSSGICAMGSVLMGRSGEKKTTKQHKVD